MRASFPSRVNAHSHEGTWSSPGSADTEPRGHRGARSRDSRSGSAAEHPAQTLAAAGRLSTGSPPPAPRHRPETAFDGQRPNAEWAGKYSLVLGGQPFDGHLTGEPLTRSTQSNPPAPTSPGTPPPPPTSHPRQRTPRHASAEARPSPGPARHDTTPGSPDSRPRPVRNRLGHSSETLSSRASPSSLDEVRTLHMILESGAAPPSLIVSALLGLAPRTLPRPICEPRRSREEDQVHAHRSV
jgi:hypothetical protein